MRAKCYPNPKEIVEPLGKPRALQVLGDTPVAINEAVQEIEIKLGHAIRPKEITVRNVFLNRLPYLTEDYPVRKLKIEGIDETLYRVDEHLGVIYPFLPLLPYTINYEVGYKDGELPATIQYLIEELARHKVAPEFNPDHEKTVNNLTVVARRLWQGLEEGRNGIKAG